MYTYFTESIFAIISDTMQDMNDFSNNGLMSNDQRDENNSGALKSMSSPQRSEQEDSTSISGTPQSSGGLPPLANNPISAQSSTVLPIIPGSSSATDDPMAQQTITGLDSAEDSDLIEKEWVVKAKNIIEKTKEDPRKQSQELENLRRDYLSKRYGKDLKSGDQ